MYAKAVTGPCETSRNLLRTQAALSAFKCFSPHSHPRGPLLSSLQFTDVFPPGTSILGVVEQVQQPDCSVSWLYFCSCRTTCCWPSLPALVLLVPTRNSRSFSAELLPSQSFSRLYSSKSFFSCRKRTLHLSFLNFPRLLLAHFSSLSPSKWQLSSSIAAPVTLPSFLGASSCSPWFLHSFKLSFSSSKIPHN